MTPQSKKPSSQVKWKEVTRVVDNYEKCEHYFEYIGSECKCGKCGMGLIGVYSIKNGKPVV